MATATSLPQPIYQEPLSPQLERIPAELKELDQWVGWELKASPGGQKPMKIPISSHTGKYASVNKPATWSSFQAAVHHYQENFRDGIGFVFTQNDPYLGIDLDDCRDSNTGDIQPWADKLVNQLNTYTEVSPSGTGLKCFSHSSQLSRGHKDKNLEIYSQGRFFTVTGHVLPGYEQIHKADITSIPILNELLKPPPQQQGNSQPDKGKGIPPLPISDNAILRKAVTAKNGHKFRLLYEGDTGQHQEDHSSADLALCRILAFWCGPRPDVIDRLYRKSKLYRDKWDVVHHGDGRTYGEVTIELAIDSQQHHFKWNGKLNRRGRPP